MPEFRRRGTVQAYQLQPDWEGAPAWAAARMPRDAARRFKHGPQGDWIVKDGQRYLYMTHEMFTAEWVQCEVGIYG